MTGKAGQGEAGYAMAALLVAMHIMAISLTMLMPAWQTMVRREREAELVFRGEQYAKAVARFQRARGAFPPSVDVLVNEKFLRKKYKDPMTENGEFQVIVVGQPIPGQATPPAAAGRGAQGAGGQGGGRGVQPGLAPGTPAPQSGFQPVTRGTAAGGGPILGVVSRSTGTSLRLYNGRNKYSEWAFVAAEATTAAGGGGAGVQRPGGPGTQRPGGARGNQLPGPPRQGGAGGGGRGLQLPPRGGGRN